jgi:hypothetical protein
VFLVSSSFAIISLLDLANQFGFGIFLMVLLSIQITQNNNQNWIPVIETNIISKNKIIILSL